MSDAPDKPSETDDSEDQALPSEDESPPPGDAASPDGEESAEAEAVEEESPEPPRRKKKKSPKSRQGGAAARKQGSARSASRSGRSGSAGALFVAIALATGLAAGWFLGTSRAGADDIDDVGPAASGSAGPAAQCTSWSEQICTETGEASAACLQAKGASELLPASACQVALNAIPATVARVKAARAVCDELVSRLCKDIGETSQMCTMVKEKTPSFPPKRCQEMVDNYDKVVGELKMMEQRGMMPPGGRPPGGMPPGAMPPQGMPPQGMPPRPKPPASSPH